MKSILTVKEVAKILSVDPETIRRWRKNGKLNGHKLGDRQWRFLKADVEEFLLNKVEQK